jgi:hypothetical protein
MACSLVICGLKKMGKVTKRYIVLVAAGTLLISGSDSSSTELPAPKPQMQSEEAGRVSEALPGVTFEVSPNTLRVCDPPMVAKVSWNAMAAGMSTVRIFVSNGEEEKLFALQGAEGSADTGPWVTAKTVFILKDGAETKQLAKFVVGSESCH